jgi:protein-tyrosine phosphatase
MKNKEKISVLFVCMGNICRSPTAEAVFRRMAAERGLERRLSADSAGTHGYHAGEPPDPRAQAAARRRGYDLGALRARRVDAADFHAFDYLLAMDRRNLAMLDKLRPQDGKARLQLFLDYAPHCGRIEVPDPYYGGAADFETVLDLTEQASRGLLERLAAELQPDRLLKK